jgi:hypothetical protein
MQARALNLLIFREDRRRVRGRDLKQALIEKISGLGSWRSADMLLATLLRSGELECAVADAAANAPGVSIEAFTEVTDRLAESLMLGESGTRGSAWEADLLGKILTAAVPEQVEVASAEGFAYYALHPLAFAEALDELPSLPPSVLVIGIRSIGTTLSAVTAASLRSRGAQVRRITVRPSGHPYNRRTRFRPEELELIRQNLAANAAFLVVDEGPGMSGSSFLSTAEAVVEAGAEPASVILICGREPEFDSLCADDGPRRARRFRWVPVSSRPRKPVGAEVFIGGGSWRRRMFPHRGVWPASWTSFERLKYLSPEAVPSRFFKFAGLGHYGKQVLEREEKIAHGGFGLLPHGEAEGFASYAWIADRVGIGGSGARAMSAAELSREVIERLAAYCAFRAKVFPAECTGLSALEGMARHNMRQLGMSVPFCLKLERAVLADGRMQPHEWLQTADGTMFKTDSGSHGDDHFFPGVTDIAWDLAGAIVEWRMSRAEAHALLESYRRASGDDTVLRIADFIAAYSAFRVAHCLMAAHALQGSEEQARLEREAPHYQKLLMRIAHTDAEKAVPYHSSRVRRRRY